MVQAQRYSRNAMALHWVIALLVAFEFGLGGRTEVLPRGAALFAVFQLHKSIGITILLLSLWRLGLRVTRSGHPAPIAKRGAAALLAKIVHWLFYIVMIGMPLSGWLLVSTAKTQVPTLLYGIIPWPHLPVPMLVHEPAESFHVLVAKFGIPLLFVLHVAGAVRHQLLLKEALVERMVPVRHAGGLTLMALVVTVLGSFALGRFAPVAETIGGVSATPAKAPAPPTFPEPSAKPAEAVVDKTEAADEVEGDETPAGSTKWSVAPGGSIGFSLPVSGQQVRGSFSRWTAAIDMDPEATKNGSIRATIDLASVSSGDAERDSMLAGSDFFAIATYPRATFVSTDIRELGGDRYQARGTLTIKGVSRPLTLPFTLAMAGDTAKVSGSARFDRRSFNVGEGQFSGTEEVGGDVTVTLSFRARRTAI